MMQYMDRIYYRMLKERRWLVTILLAGGLIVWAELAAGMSMQESLAEQVIRLHITAEDNHPEAQQSKLKVRDALAEKLEETAAKAKTREEAEERILAQIPELCAEAERICGQEVRITLAWEDFPVRYTAGRMLPAGRYRTFRVILGAGKGHNWWGMLFPEEFEDGDSESWITVSEQGSEVRFRFWLLEWWREWMSGWWESDWLCGLFQI